MLTDILSPRVSGAQLYRPPVKVNRSIYYFIAAVITSLRWVEVSWRKGSAVATRGLDFAAGHDDTGRRCRLLALDRAEKSAVERLSGVDQPATSDVL